MLQLRYLCFVGTAGYVGELALPAGLEPASTGREPGVLAAKAR